MSGSFFPSWIFQQNALQPIMSHSTRRVSFAQSPPCFNRKLCSVFFRHCRIEVLLFGHLKSPLQVFVHFILHFSSSPLQRFQVTNAFALHGIQGQISYCDSFSITSTFIVWSTRCLKIRWGLHVARDEWTAERRENFKATLHFSMPQH